MPAREIRREPFSHAGHAYAIVVVDDGKRLTAVAERSGRPVRASRVPSDPYRGGGGFTPEEVDNLIDAVKQWLIDQSPHRPGGDGP